MIRKIEKQLVKTKQEQNNKLQELSEEELKEASGGEDDSAKRSEKEIEFVFIRGLAKTKQQD